jgi:hypothetical protein
VPSVELIDAFVANMATRSLSLNTPATPAFR